MVGVAVRIGSGMGVSVGTGVDVEGDSLVVPHALRITLAITKRGTNRRRTGFSPELRMGELYSGLDALK